MGLSSDLIAQFVKSTKDTKSNKHETIAYGTLSRSNGVDYVQLDGSELKTPVSTTAYAKDGERVTVMIKNHTAVVTGNISSPSARNIDMEDAVKQISDFQIVMAYKVTTDDLDAINATIESLRATVGKFSSMEAIKADIGNLQAAFAELDYVDAGKVEALNAEIENLQAKFGKFTDLSTEDLEAINADINQLYAYTANFTYVSADVLKALKAGIDSADIKYANIDFSNIGEVAMKKFYADSGLIKDVTINNGVITGELSGVTITGDLIKANTIAADKLLIKGVDGLYHKLNSDGTTVEADQTDYNSLNGSVIAAKSITATKISVSDLVSFGATIGGFKISNNSIYSGVKETVGNTTRGIYLDDDGQAAFGDADKYIKFFKDTDNNYKLLISGAVTANENFKILTDGSMEATNGSFKGTINADNGAIGGIDISDGKLAAITTDSDNISTGFELKSDGSFISKGGTNYDYVYNLEVKSGALRLSSFYSPSGSNSQGAVLNANGLYFKEGDSNGEVLSSIYSNPSDSSLHLKSAHGNIKIESSGSVEVSNSLKVDKVYSNIYTFLESGSIIRGRSGDGGFDFYFKQNGMRIVFDGTNGKIWRVDTSGTWTTLTG